MTHFAAYRKAIEAKDVGVPLTATEQSAQLALLPQQRTVFERLTTED